MKVWPFAAALAEGGCKPPHAALAEDRRGERCGKGARDASGGDRKDGAQSSFSGIAADVSLLNKVASKLGCSRSARDEPSEPADPISVTLASSSVRAAVRWVPSAVNWPRVIPTLA